jgi:ABC-type dipeptide/oligopeptide/nickel transport system ATPase subunit
MCKTIAVMNHGEIVEIIDRGQLSAGSFEKGYTRQLFLASRGYDRQAIDQFVDF